MWVRGVFLVDPFENLMIAADPLLRKCTNTCAYRFACNFEGYEDLRNAFHGP